MLIRKDVKAQNIRISREKNAKEQFAYINENEVKSSQAKFHFRDYIMEFVVPHLTPGLLEVTQVRPEDPVEFLAEYLFKKSFEL